MLKSPFPFAEGSLIQPHDTPDFTKKEGEEPLDNKTGDGIKPVWRANRAPEDYLGWLLVRPVTQALSVILSSTSRISVAGHQPSAP